MSIESLVALKAKYDNNGRPNFGNEVLNVIVDEMKAQEARIVTLEEKMDNRMLCKNYKEE